MGSVKRHVIQAVSPHIPERRAFHSRPTRWPGPSIPGRNPGFAELLYDNRWCLSGAGRRVGPDAIARLRALWEGMGSNVDEMDADHHDLVLAVTSHAPHLIAYTMVGVADDLRRVTDTEVIKYSAAGFRDFTRIAASDPTMWRDVFLTNKDATLEILGRFTEELFALQRAIRTGDGEHLFRLFHPHPCDPAWDHRRGSGYGCTLTSDEARSSTMNIAGGSMLIRTCGRYLRRNDCTGIAPPEHSLIPVDARPVAADRHRRLGCGQWRYCGSKLLTDLPKVAPGIAPGVTADHWLSPRARRSLPLLGTRHIADALSEAQIAWQEAVLFKKRKLRKGSVCAEISRSRVNLWVGFQARSRLAD